MTRFAKSARVLSLTTMNVSLPNELKIFVDERVFHDGYGSTSEYVRDLIRRDRERGHLRDLVLEGANSSPGVVAEAETSQPASKIPKPDPDSRHYNLLHGPEVVGHILRRIAAE